MITVYAHGTTNYGERDVWEEGRTKEAGATIKMKLNHATQTMKLACRQLSSDAKHLVRMDKAPKEFDLDNLTLIPDFVNVQEHDLMLKVCLQRLRRIAGRKYEDGHMDGVIRDFKEATISSWGQGIGKYLSGLQNAQPADLMKEETLLPTNDLEPGVQSVLQRVYRQFAPETRFLPVHLLELASGTGEILPHVDNVEESGSFVAGLCLGSDAIVRFSSADGTGHVDALLPKGCFYAQRGKLRYSYLHSIPLDVQIRQWNGKPVESNQRVTVLFRDQLDKGKLPKDWQKVDAQGRSMASTRI